MFRQPHCSRDSARYLRDMYVHVHTYTPGALNVRLPHSQVFTVNRSHKRKYAPQSGCNNKDRDYCYLCNDKREVTSVGAKTRVYLVRSKRSRFIARTCETINYDPGPNFEKYDSFFFFLSERIWLRRRISLYVYIS